MLEPWPMIADSEVISSTFHQSAARALNFRSLALVRRPHTGREGHAIGAGIGLVAGLNVGLELRCNSLLSLLRCELATNRKLLPAIRTAPGDGSPVNFFQNN